MSVTLCAQPVSPAIKPDARPALSIDELLRWVVRDELPKRRDERHDGPRSGGIAPMWRHGVLGTRVDCWSREPGMPLAAGDPHPDALVVEAALAELDGLIKAAQNRGEPGPLDLSGYDVAAGLGPNLDLAPTFRRAVAGVVPWLLTIAKRGGMPDWGTGPICAPAVSGYGGKITLWLSVQQEVGMGADGQPWYVATDQVTTPSGGGKYRAGTFCKLAWKRDVKMVAEDRSVYAAWHCALAWLADRLLGTVSTETAEGRAERPALVSKRPKPPTAPASPWISAQDAPRQLRVVDQAPGADEPGRGMGHGQRGASAARPAVRALPLAA